jgi:glycosyltransferase involved in cell wall biosynthesis
VDGIDTIDRHYIPFIVDPNQLHEINRDDYFRNGHVNIISVGQFHLERKKHILLIDAVRELLPKYDIRLTLVGHLKCENSPNYQQIKNYIYSNDLDEKINIMTNLVYSRLQKEYTNHDLYVLPSENEPAAMSHLEAMSHGLPVICSDSNGTDNYISEGINGYVFQSNNLDDLTEKIEAIISDRSALIDMGCQSQMIVKQNHLPAHFCSQFNDILKTVSEIQV